MSAEEFERLLQDIINRLRKGYNPDKIILFGSFAAESATTASDIDLLIVKRTEDRFIDRWSKVREILSDSTRTLALDTFVLTPQEVSERLARGDQFLASVLQKGRVLYAAS